VDSNGVLQEDGEAMCNIVQDYFQNLFMSEVAEVDQNIMSDVLPNVTSDMNQALTKPFSGEEVKKSSISNW